MNKKYLDLFQALVKAYYNDNFDKTIVSILNDNNIEKEKLAQCISLLCGVNFPTDENFVENLKLAISSYKANEKIVYKLANTECSCKSDGETLCQTACPFNAILKDPITATTYIDMDACTDCGFCISACEMGNLMDRVEFLPIVNILKSGTPVIASVAPSIIGQFGENVSMDQLRAAFKKLGFTDMVETAFFADMLTIKEAVEFNHFVKSKNDLMITSCCCPMWVGMLKRVYEDLVKYVSPSVSPMIASGRVLKALNPDCKVVFVGPCIAKKAEAKEKDLLGDIDYVLTFQELQGIFDILDINPSELEGIPSLEYSSKGGRLYGRAGGVSIAIADAIKELYPNKYDLLSAIHVDGVPDCKAILDKAQSGSLESNFIEGMGCKGGCVGGPKAIIPTEEGKKILDDFALDSAYKVATHSEVMLDILKDIGINSLKDFKDPEKINIFERHF
ncbi:[Fe-Fe] hydrogenase large subunit C-terminal domain-containing protein [Clostridium cadaveris]